MRIRCCVLSVSLAAFAAAQEPPPHPAATLELDRHIDWIADGAAFFDGRRAKRSLTDEEKIDRNAMLDRAIAKAKAEDKLVLWYVYRIVEDSLRGRQMYRAPVLDIYAQQVLFADRTNADLIQTRFVPVRMVCDEALSARFGLRPLQFVEPALVFVDGDGRLVHYVERLRTFHAPWLAHLLVRVLDKAGMMEPPPAGASPDELLRQGRFEAALAALQKATDKDAATWLQIARVQRLLRRAEAAAESLDRAEAALPEPEGRGRRRGGDPAAALRAAIAGERGMLLSAMGQRLQAQPLLEQAFRAGGEGAAEAGYLHALNALQMGDEVGAMRRFSLVAQRYPDTLAGKKARANTLLGPDDRPIGAAFTGFETVAWLPEAAYRGPLPRDTTWAGERQSPRAMAVRALRFLLAQQRDDGGFTDSRYAYWPDTEITPNVWVAITALGCTALVEYRGVFPDEVPDREIDAALARGESFLFDPKRLNRGANEDVYSDAYRLLYLSRKGDRLDPQQRRSVVDRMNALVQQAQTRQYEDGFWAHEYRNAFCTGAMMWGLLVARSGGATVPDEVLDRGAAALLSARTEDGAYAYSGTAANRPANRKDASGRMPICEGVLLALGRSDRRRLESALDNFWQHMDRLETVRRNDFHSDGELAGFFFFHSLFHVSEVLALLPEDERGAHRRRFVELLQRIPEMDGSFLDSHELGRSYGTAMALLTLRNVADF